MSDKRIGNQFWKQRATHGRAKIFETPEILWEAASEYFEWVHANPLQEEKGFAFQGVVTKETFAKMRAMTIGGLCIFLDVDNTTWDLYRKRKDFIGVCTRIEAVIRTQKFEGASAELLNPSIIARDLGLADKKQIDINTEQSLFPDVPKDNSDK